MFNKSFNYVADKLWWCSCNWNKNHTEWKTPTDLDSIFSKAKKLSGFNKLNLILSLMFITKVGSPIFALIVLASWYLFINYIIKSAYKYWSSNTIEENDKNTSYYKDIQYQEEIKDIEPSVGDVRKDGRMWTGRNWL